jgi:hypothetical protein
MYFSQALMKLLYFLRKFFFVGDEIASFIVISLKRRHNLAKMNRVPRRRGNLGILVELPNQTMIAAESSGVFSKLRFIRSPTMVASKVFGNSSIPFRLHRSNALVPRSRCPLFLGFKPRPYPRAAM